LQLFSVSLSLQLSGGADQQVTQMGRAFTAAPPLLLLGLLALGLGAATANVSGAAAGAKNRSKNLSFFSIRGCPCGGFHPEPRRFLLNSGGRLLLHERGLRRRAVVLRLRAQLRRLPLRPLRHHQPLPAHCKPPQLASSLSSLLVLESGRGAAAVVLYMCLFCDSEFVFQRFLDSQICSLLS